jgi:thiol-disulfide isomerase/thioredoxin
MEAEVLRLDEKIFDYDKIRNNMRLNSFFIDEANKTFLITVASKFEIIITGKIKTVLESISLSTRHFEFVNMKLDENIYKKFITNTKDGTKSCAPFYKAFKTSFKDDLRSNFEQIKGKRIEFINDEYSEIEEKAVITDDWKGEIDNCDFIAAEESFLQMKYFRNKIAHDYLDAVDINQNNIPSFNEIDKLYQKALLYVWDIFDTLN